MINIRRLAAVSMKEWQLDLRFPAQFFIQNLIGPIKTAVLLFLVYGGLLRRTGTAVGVLNHENYRLYISLGAICHSLFTGCSNLFMSKLTMEKWWQTLTATLITPASSLEINLGVIFGGGVMQIMMSTVFLAILSVFVGASFKAYIAGVSVLAVIALYAFGLSLIGSTISLCFEGKSFLYDYTFQLIVFLSCFYYPPEVLPKTVQLIAAFLPTFQLARLIKELFISGPSAFWTIQLASLGVGGMIMFLIPSILLEKALKRFGIVGY